LIGDFIGLHVGRIEQFIDVYVAVLLFYQFDVVIDDLAVVGMCDHT
jgi:hypothetical protein